MLPEVALIVNSTKPMSVNELSQLTGKSQPVVSRNLQRAKRQKLIIQLADKTYVPTSANQPKTKIDPYIAQWSAQFTDDEANAQVQLLKLAYHLIAQGKALEARILYWIETGSKLSKSDLDTKSMLTIHSDSDTDSTD